MTLIICNRVDCMYSKRRKDYHYQCRCTALGIDSDGRCDSFMELPDIAKKQAQTNGQKLCNCQCHRTYKFWRQCCGRAGIDWIDKRKNHKGSPPITGGIMLVDR